MAPEEEPHSSSDSRSPPGSPPRPAGAPRRSRSRSAPGRHGEPLQSDLCWECDRCDGLTWYIDADLRTVHCVQCCSDQGINYLLTFAGLAPRPSAAQPHSMWLRYAAATGKGPLKGSGKGAPKGSGPGPAKGSAKGPAKGSLKGSAKDVLPVPDEVSLPGPTDSVPDVDSLPSFADNSEDEAEAPEILEPLPHEVLEHGLLSHHGLLSDVEVWDFGSP